MRNLMIKLLLFSLTITCCLCVQHFCDREDHTTSVDISKSKITKNAIYEYKI